MLKNDIAKPLHILNNDTLLILLVAIPFTA